MLMMNKKPKDEGNILNCIGIMSDLVDRSDQVVGGTTERVVEARIVCRMPEEQRGDARDAKSTRGVRWQQTSTETAEGELENTASVASVRVTGTVVEPREDKALWFCGSRATQLAKCGLRGMPCGSVGRRSVETHGKECRERIRVDTMCDDTGQERLRTAEERLAPAASAARAEAAQEGHASPAWVEVAQESRDEEMTEACDEQR